MKILFCLDLTGIHFQQLQILIRRNLIFKKWKKPVSPNEWLERATHIYLELKKKDYTIVHLFVFDRSTHSVAINIKSQFLQWKNYPPFFPKHWNTKNRCLDLISNEKCSFLARNSLANREGQNMEICWPVPVFTSSNVTLASLINKH